ncbi:MAG TPA: GGDEF domain-containing protein [Solirubrobacterales bacterium]
MSRSEEVTLNGVNAAKGDARDATRRDYLARARDIEAAERDRSAETRDREISSAEQSLSPDGPVTEGLRHQLRALLGEAAADRESAADDRRLAAEDRARAAEERARAVAALNVAHFDDLTGAHRRGFGEDVLRGEIDRAGRTGQPLFLVMVDIDGLKDVNDERGHLAGDALLQDLVAAIRANVRSYEPIVRLGGDEFAFTIGGVDRAGAEERCAAICADLAERPSHGRITAGIGELHDGDELADLFGRADRALLDARSERRSHSR